MSGYDEEKPKKKGRRGLSEFIEEEKELKKLREALKSTREKLDSAKKSRDELIAAVRKEVREAVLTIEIPPVKPFKLDSRNETSETAICVVSDWQLSKTTPTYNSKVAVERLNNYVRKVVKITDIQRKDHPVKHCNVYLIGDLIEGELIFPGQAHKIDASMYRQIFDIGSGALANSIRTLLANFETVHVNGVIGNHGAIGGWVSKGSRHYHPESNADSMLYEVTRLLLRDEKNLSWSDNIVLNERKWYAVDQVGDFGFLIFHGDQIPTSQSWAGIPFYGFLRSLLGWHAGGVPEKFDYSLSGHFHVPFQIPYGLNHAHWGNGSLESDNTYAMELRAGRRDPMQWLLFCHPTKGVTGEYKVWVKD